MEQGNDERYMDVEVETKYLGDISGSKEEAGKR